jgi:hypothetical protein
MSYVAGLEEWDDEYNKRYGARSPYSSAILTDNALYVAIIKLVIGHKSTISIKMANNSEIDVYILDKVIRVKIHDGEQAIAQISTCIDLFTHESSQNKSILEEVDG